MSKAKAYTMDGVAEVAYEGTIDFDEISCDSNTIDLYEVAVVDDLDNVVSVERYTDFDSWQAAQYRVSGRESLDMDREELRDVVVRIIDNPLAGRYDVEACVHVAYVIDHGEQ